MSRCCPHCGCDIDDHPRSPKQHRRFFGVIAAAFNQWPHDNEFQPETSEHLRARLLVQAGWRRRFEVELNSMDEVQMAATALKAMMAGLHQHVFVTISPTHSKLIGYAPKSIAYMTKKEMDHFEACRIFGRVDEIICAAIGVDNTDKLLDEAKRAA